MSLIPAFVAFTGMDHADSMPAMQALANLYPIEWGILLDASQHGVTLFPNACAVESLQKSGMRLAAHICGEAAHHIVMGREPEMNLAGFSRIQINHGRHGATEEVIENVARVATNLGVRAVLQCQGSFPADARVDWLFDVSFGEGRKPNSFPELSPNMPFCGYSGGFSPGNIHSNMERLQVADCMPFWIDMESGVRSEGRFDLKKCELVCQAVYGSATTNLQM